MKDKETPHELTTSSNNVKTMRLHRYYHSVSLTYLTSTVTTIIICVYLTQVPHEGEAIVLALRVPFFDGYFRFSCRFTVV